MPFKNLFSWKPGLSEISAFLNQRYFKNYFCKDRVPRKPNFYGNRIVRRIPIVGYLTPPEATFYLTTRYGSIFSAALLSKKVKLWNIEPQSSYIYYNYSIMLYRCKVLKCRIITFYRRFFRQHIQIQNYSVLIRTFLLLFMYFTRIFRYFFKLRNQLYFAGGIVYIEIDLSC